MLQRSWDIVKLIKGRPCIVHGPDSETLLHVPEDVYAVLLGNIGIYSHKIKHHIPRNDCLVTPICEYHLQPFNGRRTPVCTKFKLRVPHILRKISQVKDSIRIRYGDVRGIATLPLLERNNFEIDEKYLNISISHFSGFIVTAEGINCCSSSANMILYGSLANSSEMGPLVTVRAYLGSMNESQFSVCFVIWKSFECLNFAKIFADFAERKDKINIYIPFC